MYKCFEVLFNLLLEDLAHKTIWSILVGLSYQEQFLSIKQNGIPMQNQSSIPPMIKIWSIATF